MKHATVKIGEFEIPLIGVPQDATQQKCEGCGKNFHLTEITLDADGKPKCPECLSPATQTRCKGDQAAESDAEFAVTMQQELQRRLDKLHNQAISLAERAAESRDFLDWHTDHVKKAWLDWMDESNKVLESIRQTRVAISFESRQLLTDCGDVRKFFLSDDHEKEIAKLREFIELCERLRSLKNDGTLDKIADTILKLA